MQIYDKILKRSSIMKKLISLLFLFNQIIYSAPLDEIKNSYEYLLAKAIWSLVLTNSTFIIVGLFLYYFLFYLVVKLNLQKLYSVININLFKNGIENKENLIDEIDTKILKTLLLFLIWALSLGMSKVFNAFPFFSLLVFINIIKPLVIATFPTIEKSTIEKFLLVFLLILLCLGLGNTNDISPNIF